MMKHNSILISLYTDAISSLHCQICRGRTNTAKPLMILAMINLIDKGDITDGLFDIESMKNEYVKLQSHYSATTPYQYPLYFLENESFYHLKWNENRVFTHTPSAKLIRENVKYAYLDNALWDLLQEQEMRDYFRKIIIEHYLKDDTK